MLSPNMPKNEEDIEKYYNEILDEKFDDEVVIKKGRKI